MTKLGTPIKKEQQNNSSVENKKRIKNNKKLDLQLEEIAKYPGVGHHEKANNSTIKTHGNSTLAIEVQREYLKNYVSNK